MRRSRTLVSILALLVCGCSRADETDVVAPTAPPSAIESVQNSTAAQANEPKEVAHLTRVAWWNDPAVVDNLKLTLAQRNAMDELLTHYMDRRAQLRPSQPDGQSTFWDLLITGSRKDVQTAAIDLLQRSTEPRRQMLDLKMGVVFAMSDSQRRKFAESYPHLIRRPWVVGGDGGHRKARFKGKHSQELRR